MKEAAKSITWMGEIDDTHPVLLFVPFTHPSSALLKQVSLELSSTKAIFAPPCFCGVELSLFCNKFNSFVSCPFFASAFRFKMIIKANSKSAATTKTKQTIMYSPNISNSDAEGLSDYKPITFYKK